MLSAKEASEQARKNAELRNQAHWAERLDQISSLMALPEYTSGLSSSILVGDIAAQINHAVNGGLDFTDYQVITEGAPPTREMAAWALGCAHRYKQFLESHGYKVALDHPTSFTGNNGPHSAYVNMRISWYFDSE